MTSSPTITIAICTFNRCKPLRQSLDSLSQLQTGGDFTYEIVVVDDGSTDETESVVRDFAASASCEVQYVRQQAQGIAAARNHCVRRARGAWIAFFDDDQLAEPDWLGNLYAFALEKQARCVGSARDLFIDDIDPNQLPPVTRAVLGELVHPNEHQCARRPMLSTGTVLIERTVFEEVGGFDESLQHGGSDSDLFARMRRAGIPQWFTPAAVCHHLIPTHRVRPRFLFWCSRRNGVSFALQDVKEFGRFKTALLAMARLGRTAVVVVPRTIGYGLTGRTQHAIGQLCLAFRDFAYARNVAHLAMSRQPSAAKFLDALEYRKERLSI